VVAYGFLIVSRFALDQGAELFFAEGTMVVTKARHEGTAVVKAQVALVVSFFAEADPFLAEHPLEQLKMDRLIVDDDAVEVEDHGAKHSETIADKFFCFN